MVGSGRVITGVITDSCYDRCILNARHLKTDHQLRDLSGYGYIVWHSWIKNELLRQAKKSRPNWPA
jgi:hypothetical protein